jgi:hypothetical protein
MPSNRNQSEQNAQMLNSLFGSAPSTAPSSPPPAAPARPRRSRRTAAAVATAVVAATSPVVPSAPQTLSDGHTTVSSYVGETTGLESKEVRAIELCARKMELLALQAAVQTELADLDNQLARLKRSA